MTREAVNFIHISDTHIGPTRDFCFHGLEPLPSTELIVDKINNLPVRPDFVVHTGDVVAGPEPDSYKLAAESFSKLNVPIYFVTGNHDASRYIRRFLPLGPRKEVSDDEDLLSYTFDLKGFRFVAIDARGPDEIDPHGIVPAGQLEFIRRLVQADSSELAVFIHFPALKLGSAWVDREMLLLNGEDFHKALLPGKSRLRGVFCGHVHRGIQMFADGILYTSVPGVIGQFSTWPADEVGQLDCSHAPSFNFVTLTPERTIIKEHSVSRP
jgi:3',5'-cyclic AMP phosphodiesterase CpdA